MESANNESILIAIITITILFFLFSVFIVFYFLTYRRNQKRYQEKLAIAQKEFERQKLESQVELQEMTYKHIAKELHDNVGQLMGTTKMLLSVAGRQNDAHHQVLSEADQTLSKAIHEIRHLSRSLDNEWLEQFELYENLMTEASRINASGLVQLEVESDADINMDKPRQIILFRVIQEGIQNALRHAHPSFVSVRMKHQDGLLIDIVNDGMPLPEHFHGMGTNNMRKRVQVLGGQIQWLQVEGNTMVAIALPNSLA